MARSKFQVGDAVRIKNKIIKWYGNKDVAFDLHQIGGAIMDKEHAQQYFEHRLFGFGAPYTAVIEEITSTKGEDGNNNVRVYVSLGNGVSFIDIFEQSNLKKVKE